MAEENEQQNEQEENAQEGGGKKKLIIIIVAVLLAVGVAIGVTLFLLGGDDGDSEGEDIAAEEVVEPKAPAIYYDVKPALLTTFNVGGRQRYMQINLSVMSREQAAIDAVEYHLPFIKSRLNSLYSSQNFEGVQQEGGKESLRAETLAVINEVLSGEGESEIENVFFTNFVMQ